MTVHCPRCELIFESKSELAAHLEEDHGWRDPSSGPHPSGVGGKGNDTGPGGTASAGPAPRSVA